MERFLPGVAEIVAKATLRSVEEIQRDSRLDDLGLQSADFVDLVLALEERFGVEIPDLGSDDVSLNTVGEIAQVLATGLSVRPPEVGES